MKKVVFFIILCLFFFCSYGQRDKSKDVKVGLVLSGGGAKGLAHIGALKVIEESGVRIDYIGGTSMGAIIGALYASGYRAEELDSIFKTVDFNTLIQDELPRSAKTFHEKEDAERYALTLPFDHFKISFPSAISKGQNVYNLLVKLLYHVNHITNFNKLPIPFFCVATDVETGEPVVLNKGYLPEAIAASGAFPSLFEPIEIDGKVLIDGGVVNNYPVDEVRQLGAGVIIGIDVQDDLEDRNTLKSAPGILLQINNYRTVNDMKKKSKDTEIYIKPNISDFTVISFEQGAQIIKNGEEAARENFAQLLEIATKQQHSTQRKKAVVIKDTLFINKLEIEGNKNYSRAYIRGKLRCKTPEKITFEKLQQGIGNLAATNNFKGIRYKILPEEKNEKILLTLQEKENTTFLKMAVHYDNLYKSGVLLNITKKRLLTDDDTALFDIVLGDNVRYNFEYNIDKGFYWSFGLKSRFNSFTQDVTSDFVQTLSGMDIPVNKIAIEVSDFTNQAYLQTIFREEFLLGIGVEHKHFAIESETIADVGFEETTFEKSDFISAFGTLVLDTYDDTYFPRKGLYFNGNFHFYLYSSDYTNQFEEFSMVKGKFGMATSILKNIAFNFSAEGGFKLGNTDLSSLDFFLGGYGNNFINNFIPFLGYDFLSFGGDSFVKVTFNLDYEVFKKNHLNLTANYANAANDLFSSTTWIRNPDFSGYGIGYGLETFIGPIEAKYTWSSETKKGQWFVNVGFWF
jgi:NTE family protein